MTGIIDFSQGILDLSGTRIGGGDYTFEDFKQTAFYSGQDGILIIYLAEQAVIRDKSFYIGLCFLEGRLYRLSLVCSDADISFENEPERKKLHDEILASWGIQVPQNYSWGQISSDYDQKGNVSSINLVYNIN